MGCCTRFNRTWWPGYNSEVIDPNKAFDFQRRLRIVKKFLVALFLIALIAASIYLILLFTSKADCSENPLNGTVAEAFKGNSSIANKTTSATNSTITSKPENEHLNQAHFVLPTTVFGQTLENKTTKVTTTPVPVPNLVYENETLSDNSTLTKLNEVQHEVHINSSSSKKETEPPLPIQIMDSEGPRSWCSAKKNLLECIGLTESFKTVKTFVNNTSPNATVKGYIMVKVDDNDIWHPYCYKGEWTLQMGYKLCHGLGFADLKTLETINVADLKARVTILGKDISFDNLTVVPRRRNFASVSESEGDQSGLNCTVGEITCGPKPSNK